MAEKPAQTHRRRAGNPDRALEPRTDHRPRSTRGHLRAQADAVHHRAQDAADHGGEGSGAPRREAARAHLRGRPAAGMDAAATRRRPAAARLQRSRAEPAAGRASRLKRRRRKNSPSCAVCSTNTKRGRDDSARKLGTHSRRCRAGLDTRTLALGRRAGGAAARRGATGCCARRAPATSRAAWPCSPC